MTTQPQTQTISVTALTQIIRRTEGYLAPGSETSLWGDYLERMRVLTGSLPTADDDGSTVSRGEAAWWMGAYCALEAWVAGGGSVLDDDGVPMMGLSPTDGIMSDVSSVEGEIGPMTREEVSDMRAGYEWQARQLIDSVD